MLDELVSFGDERQEWSGEEIRRDSATDVAVQASIAV